MGHFEKKKNYQGHLEHLKQKNTGRSLSSIRHNANDVIVHVFNL